MQAYAYLDFLGEGGTEHHGLASSFSGHGVLLHNTSDLRFKTHIKHSVCLIKDQITKKKIVLYFE